MPTERSPETPQPRPDAPSLWQTIASVAAAFFGVQSSRNRVRDFTHGKPIHFIIVGVSMALVLVLTLVMVVRLLLKNAGI